MVTKGFAPSAFDRLHGVDARVDDLFDAAATLR